MAMTADKLAVLLDALRPAGRVALATALLLLVPLLAMLFTDRIAWGPGDFAMAGILLFGAGLAYEFAKRKHDGFAYRAASASPSRPPSSSSGSTSRSGSSAPRTIPPTSCTSGYWPSESAVPPWHAGDRRE